MTMKFVIVDIENNINLNNYNILQYNGTMTSVDVQTYLRWWSWIIQLTIVLKPDGFCLMWLGGSIPWDHQLMWEWVSKSDDTWIFWCDHWRIMIDCIATYTAASSSSWVWCLIAYAKTNHEFLKILRILEDDECWCYRTCLFIDVLWQRHRPQFPTSGPLSRFGAANFRRQHIDVSNIQKIMSNLVRFLWSMGISGS